MLDFIGEWKSQAWAAASSSMATTAAAFSIIGSRRRAPCAAIETWSSWLAEVGMESTLAGKAFCLFSDTSAAASDLRDHEARVQARDWA